MHTRCNFTCASLGKNFVYLICRRNYGCLKSIYLLLFKLLLMQEFLVSFFADKSDFVAERSKSFVRIVLTENQAILTSRCHHSVRLVCTLGYKVIYKCADIRACSVENERRFSEDFQSGINSGNKSLCCRFFVTRTAVELTCTEKVWKIFKFKRCKHSCRVNAIVFNCIGRAHNYAVFKTFYGVVKLELYLFGK